MSKIDLNSNNEMVVIPLKEYNYLKSVVNKIGKKIESQKDPDFLTPLQLKRINEIDEKIKKGDWSSVIDFDVMKRNILNKRTNIVRLKNRKKSRKILK